MPLGVYLRNLFPTGPAVKGVWAEVNKGSQLKPYTNKIHFLMLSSSCIFMYNPHIIKTFISQ